jgi:hypothetical protein
MAHFDTNLAHLSIDILPQVAGIGQPRRVTADHPEALGLPPEIPIDCVRERVRKANSFQERQWESEILSQGTLV